MMLNDEWVETSADQMTGWRLHWSNDWGDFLHRENGRVDTFFYQGNDKAKTF